MWGKGRDAKGRWGPWTWSWPRRGSRGNLVEDEGTERDEELKRLSPSKQKCSKSALVGSRGRFPGIWKMGPTLADTQKGREFVVHTQSIGQASQLYSSMCQICPVSSHFLHWRLIPARTISLQDNQFPLLLLPSKLLSTEQLSYLFKTETTSRCMIWSLPTHPMSLHFSHSAFFTFF